MTFVFVVSYHTPTRQMPLKRQGTMALGAARSFRFDIGAAEIVQ